MPRLTHLRVGLVALSFAGALNSPVVLAQSGPTDIPGVMAICTPVINEEYDRDMDRWGQCIAAVGDLLDHLGAPTEAANPIIADLVVALTELYRQRLCPVETELPQAIELAATRSTDDEQHIQILEISDTIADCAVFATAAVRVPASDF
jgi:hypothetical protein